MLMLLSIARKTADAAKEEAVCPEGNEYVLGVPIISWSHIFIFTNGLFLFTMCFIIPSPKVVVRRRAHISIIPVFLDSLFNMNNIEILIQSNPKFPR